MERAQCDAFYGIFSRAAVCFCAGRSAGQSSLHHQLRTPCSHNHPKPVVVQDHPVWQCWLLHYQYVMLCLQRQFDLDDIRSLDMAIFQMQTLFLSIYGEKCWLPKNNFAQHFPMDILRWGPLRSTWCMMFEHMNQVPKLILTPLSSPPTENRRHRATTQVLKHSALRTNFADTLMTAATRLAQSLAFDLYCQTHIDFMKPILEVRLVEMCMHGTSPTIDYLILMRMIAYTVAGLRVTWLSKAKIANAAFAVNDLVLAGLHSPLAPSGRVYYLAQILDLFAIESQTFVQLILIKQGTARGAPPTTWAQLGSAARVALQECTFAEVGSVSLVLLHPVSQRSSPGQIEQVSFVMW